MPVTAPMKLRDLKAQIDHLCRLNDDSIPVYVEHGFQDKYGNVKTSIDRVLTIKRDDVTGPAITIRTESSCLL